MSIERAKIGLLMIGGERFRPLGNGTKDGNYEERKALEAKTYLSRFCNFADVVCPATVYSREGAETAAAEFYNQKVDCVVAMFLSWAEDFAWIRFQREVCIGTLEQVTERVRVFAAASHMRAKLRRTNLSLLACYNEAMWATYVDPYNIFYKIGPEIHFLSVAELVNEIEATPDSTVDALLLPGGTAPEKLRQNADILAATRAFFEAHKTVATICHGPLILISAKVLCGRHCTCYPGIRDDAINAGALYENSPVVIDGNLITSRRPDDLPDFMRAFIKQVNSEKR